MRAVRAGLDGGRQLQFVGLAPAFTAVAPALGYPPYAAATTAAPLSPARRPGSALPPIARGRPAEEKPSAEAAARRDLARALRAAGVRDAHGAALFPPLPPGRGAMRGRGLPVAHIKSNEGNEIVIQFILALIIPVAKWNNHIFV